MEPHKASKHDGSLSLPPSACEPAASPNQDTTVVPKSSSELSSCCLRRGPRRASDSRFSGLSTIPEHLNEDAVPGQGIVLARQFAAGLVTIAQVLFFY